MIGRRYPKAGKTLGEGLGRGVLRMTLGWNKFICCLHVHSTSEASCFMEGVNVFLKPPRGQARHLFRCWLPKSSLLFWDGLLVLLGTSQPHGVLLSPRSLPCWSQWKRKITGLTEALGTAGFTIQRVPLAEGADVLL